MSAPDLGREVRRLALTLAALVALTLTSWGLAQVTGGVGGAVVAFAIAVAKSLLVAIVFMEVRRAGTTAIVAGVVAVAFIALLVGGSVADVATR